MQLLLPADVTNIKCEFVQKVLAFLARRHYSVSTCVCTLYPYYARYAQLAAIDEDCLGFDDECHLKDNSNEVTLTDCDTAAPCSSQVTITLGAAESACAGIAETINTTCNCKFPTVTLTNNSEYIGATIQAKSAFTGSCNTTNIAPEYETVVGGCTSSGCSDNYKSIASFGFDHSLLTGYYFHRMYIQYTDATGAIAGSKTLELHPLLSPYLTASVDCPGCTAIVPAELVFTHANFESAFATLMDNVSLALFGTTGNHRITAVIENGIMKLRCKAVHNPSGELFGPPAFNTPGAPSNRFIVVNDANFPYNYPITRWGDQDVAPYHRPIKFYYEYTATAPGTDYTCADLTDITIGDQVTYPQINLVNTGFNKISLASSIADTNYPIEVTANDTSSCSSFLLTAVYTTDEDVDSVTWQDPLSVEISTTNTAIATDPGTYTFTVFLENGCEVSQTILVD